MNTINQTITKFVLTITLLTVALSASAQKRSYLNGGKQFLDCNIFTQSGNKVFLADAVSSDAKTIVVFFADWCIPCHKQMEAIKQKESELNGSKKVNVVLVALGSCKKNAEELKKELANMNIDYPLYFDKQNDAFNTYRIQAFPHTLIVENNKLVYSQRGFMPEFMNDILAVVTK